MKTDCAELQKYLMTLNNYAINFSENISEIMYIEENNPKIAGLLTCYESGICVMRDFGQSRHFRENVL